MFDGNVADALQLISLPLELTGFGLALVEIRFRRFARHLRRQILELTETSRAGFFAAVRDNHRRQTPVERRTGLAILVASALGTGVLATVVVLREERTLALFFGGVLAVSLLLPFLLGPLLRSLIRRTLAFVSTFARGREIGVLGLLLAGLGILAESYQVGQLIEAGVGFQGSALPSVLLVIGSLLVTIVAIGVVGSALLYRFPALRRFLVRREARPHPSGEGTDEA